MLMRGSVVSQLATALIIALAAGCMTITRERPLPVQVIDAETKRPIPAAQVQIDYTVLPPAWVAWGASLGATDRDGIARLWAAPGDGGITVESAAIGYLSDAREVTATS